MLLTTGLMIRNDTICHVSELMIRFFSTLSSLSRDEIHDSHGENKIYRLQRMWVIKSLFLFSNKSIYCIIGHAFSLILLEHLLFYRGMLSVTN